MKFKCVRAIRDKYCGLNIPCPKKVLVKKSFWRGDTYTCTPTGTCDGGCVTYSESEEVASILRDIARLYQDEYMVFKFKNTAMQSLVDQVLCNNRTLDSILLDISKFKDKYTSDRLMEADLLATNLRGLSTQLLLIKQKIQVSEYCPMSGTCVNFNQYMGTPFDKVALLLSLVIRWNAYITNSHIEKIRSDNLTYIQSNRNAFYAVVYITLSEVLNKNFDYLDYLDTLDTIDIIDSTKFTKSSFYTEVPGVLDFASRNIHIETFKPSSDMSPNPRCQSVIDEIYVYSKKLTEPPFTVLKGKLESYLQVWKKKLEISKQQELTDRKNNLIAAAKKRREEIIERAYLRDILTPEERAEVEQLDQEIGRIGLEE